jgi:hypothetical protein
LQSPSCRYYIIFERHLTAELRAMLPRSSTFFVYPEAARLVDRKVGALASFVSAEYKGQPIVFCTKHAIMQPDMGFPTWTLWGMGLSAFGALLAIGLALIAQTPRLLSRLGLTRFRIDLRARSFTVYGFALLLLGMGFFLAGVPLDEADRAANSPQTAAVGESPAADESGVLVEDGAEATEQPALEATGSGPNGESETTGSGTTGSGAFVGLPELESEGTPITVTVPAELAGELATPVNTTSVFTTTATISATESSSAAAFPSATSITEATAAPTATTTPSPTSTMTPTAEPPTITPTSTVTPTPLPTATSIPLEGPTATIGSGTSTLWVRRTPGGANLILLRRGDTVILLAGHANYAGIVWQQVSTLDGIEGWVQSGFLDFEETSQVTQ